MEVFAIFSPIIPFMGVRRERDYLVQAREQGQACVTCGRFIPGPPAAARRCDDCAKISTHRVCMSFTHRDGWHCQFLESDLKTPLPRKLTFATSDKVRALAQRGGAFKNLENQQAFDHAVEIGRGGIYLELTEEQYRKLG